MRCIGAAGRLLTRAREGSFSLVAACCWHWLSCSWPLSSLASCHMPLAELRNSFIMWHASLSHARVCCASLVHDASCVEEACPCLLI